jgi:hypothetical protein
MAVHFLPNLAAATAPPHSMVWLPTAAGNQTASIMYASRSDSLSTYASRADCASVLCPLLPFFPLSLSCVYWSREEVQDGNNTKVRTWFFEGVIGCSSSLDEGVIAARTSIVETI